MAYLSQDAKVDMVKVHALPCFSPLQNAILVHFPLCLTLLQRYIHARAVYNYIINQYEWPLLHVGAYITCLHILFLL